MVIISNDGPSLGTIGGIRDRKITGYRVVARVPHEWASKTFSKISGNGVGLTTAYKDITVFHLSDDHPEFEKLLTTVITKCADKEKDSIGTLDDQIRDLETKRAALLLEMGR